MGNIYHGSRNPNLKEINQNKSGHVYATTDKTVAAIFSGKKRNTLVAKWWKDENGKMHFLDIKKGSFDNFYENISCSIYVLDDTNFYTKEGLSPFEKISDHTEPVQEEIKIESLKEFLLKQEDFEFIPNERIGEYIPDLDAHLERHIKGLREKFGNEHIDAMMKDQWPELLEKETSETENIS